MKECCKAKRPNAGRRPGRSRRGWFGFESLELCASAALILTAAFWIVLVSGCASASTKHGIPNFRQFDLAVYRSGQPDNNGEGLVYLHFIGITDIVKLDEDSEGSDAAAKLLGIRVHYFPITFRQQMGIDPIDVVALERLIDSLPSYGVEVHCKNGWDRTGLFCALWRMRKDGWSKVASEQEMIALGFHRSLAGLWWTWKGVAP